MTKVIAIEEHFVTPEIRAAWANSSLGQEGVGGLNRQAGRGVTTIFSARLNWLDLNAFCSTDYPYQYRQGRPGRLFIDQTALSPQQKEMFAHGNWESLTALIRRG